jgi:hypothetical protein
VRDDFGRSSQSEWELGLERKGYVKTVVTDRAQVREGYGSGGAVVCSFVRPLRARG